MVMKKSALVTGPALKSFSNDVYSAWEVEKRQVSQAAANYDPFGAKGGKGCANCQWFISPNSCVLVNGDISPSGMSKFYTAVEDVADSPVPYPVYVVDSPTTKEAAAPVPVSSNPLKNAWDWLVGKKDATAFRPFFVVKGKGDEQWRVFMIYSNNFKDNTSEIICEAAHKEYIAWADKTGNYPEMHLWHGGPGTRWGQVDFLDYVDGFAISSGLVDKGKEHIATALEVDAKQGKLKVSHGFLGLKSADGTYLIYRGFEQSPLPIGAEANSWTGLAFDVLETKESDMAFQPEKRAWLKDKLGVDDNTIASLEGSFKGMADSLKAVGVEFKEEGTAPIPDNALATVLAEFKSVGDGVKSLADNVAVGLKAVDEKHSGAIGELTNTVKSLTETVTKLGEEIKKSQDAIVADAYKNASGAAPQGYRASEQATSAAASTKEANNGPGNQDWLSNLLDTQLGVGFGSAVSTPQIVPPAAPAPAATNGGS